MKVISISTDRNIFKDGSDVRRRQIEYGGLFDELHIVVFSKRSETGSLQEQVQIAANVFVYPTNSFSKFFYVRDASNIAKNIARERKLSPEDSVITTQDPFETGLVGLRIEEGFGLPLHVQIHVDFLNPNFSRGFSKAAILNRFRLKIARKILPAADAVRVVSKRILESLELSNIHLKKAPIVLPIFTDIEMIENARVKIDLKKKYPQFNFIILTASRLAPEKNIPLAITAVARLIKAYPYVGLIVTGEGPEKNRLRSLSKKLGVENHVIFEPWQDDIISYYKSTNLFLSTSLYEGYGLSVVEAVAAHCPTVATDTGIAGELLHDGGETFICPPTPFAAAVGCLSSKIRLLIEKSDLREKYIHEAVNRLDRIVIRDKSDYLALYKKSIESAIL